MSVKLPLLQVVSNNKSFSVGVQSDEGAGKDDQKHKIWWGGVPNRRSLNSDKWKVTGHKRIEKDS